MTDLAKHIRIFNPNPEDDFVEKRKKAVDALETGFRKRKNLAENLKLANDIIKSISNPRVPLQSVTDETELALKKQSTAFVAEGQQLQMLTCAMIAALQYLEKTKPSIHSVSKGDAFGIGIWSGLSFQVPIAVEEKLENLRQELLGQAQHLLTSSSIQSRQRRKIVTPQITRPTENTATAIIDSFEALYQEAIESLVTNAVLDREEIDILWWVLGGWSSICSKSLDGMNVSQKAIVSGLEIASILRRVPGQVHKNLVNRFIPNDEEIDGIELLERLGDMLPSIVSAIGSYPVVGDNPSIFPLFTILKSGRAETDAEKLKRPLSEWAQRALLEMVICNMNKFVNDGE